MSKVDPDFSKYHEDPSAEQEFDRTEVKNLRLLLRRLRFLEKQVRESGGIMAPGGSGGAAMAESERDALEWALIELDYLDEARITQPVPAEARAVSRNRR